MAHTAHNGQRYEVHCSGAIAKELLQIQKRAKAEGRGDAVLVVIRALHNRLVHDPLELGEPLYHLPKLRLQVRHCALGPLLLDFAVHEDKPLVFIKGAALLPQRLS